jgi:phage terminase large subunit GpA-like protein
MQLQQGLPDAGLLVARAFASGIAPPPDRTVAEWADACRVLGPEEGPFPGPWRTDRVPYLREVMECLSLSHPSRRVTLMASAQVGKTMCFLNFAGQIISETPATVLWVLPSLDEAGKFNKDKLEPLLANSPAVAKKVRAIVSRDDTGSTTRRKVFPGGNIDITGANSSKGLQMVTKRVILLDEVSEFPLDVDGRGDPVSMAEARTTAWTGREKIGAASTPGMKGSCRISERYGEGSGGVFEVPCPACEHRQALKFDNLRWPAGEPEKALYHCDGCGVGIEHRHKAAMLAAGTWRHERPHLVAVHASFAINALYSPFVSWAWVADQRDKSKDDPLRDKVFTQQVLGLPYEPRYDLPSHELLWRRREPWPPRRIPPSCLFLTGAVDVQGDRLEWAVYAWDRHMGAWWIDGGILEGDPALDPVWLALDDVLNRTWPDAWGRDWPLQALGVDSGYLPQRVYAFARRHAHRAEPRVMALDGRPRWGEPPIGTPKPQDVDYAGRKIGSCLLWPVGTWDLKTEVAAALRLTEMGPDADNAWPKGAMRFPQALDLGFFEQLTAEACVDVGNRAGFTKREWRKVRPRNEQWDLAVYARALARHETSQFTEANWDALAARRLGRPDEAQLDLASVWAPGLKAEAEAAQRSREAPPPAPPPPPEPAAQHWLAARRAGAGMRSWLNDKR